MKEDRGRSGSKTNFGQAGEKIIEILEDMPGFSGLKGFEIDSRSSRSRSTKNAIDSQPKRYRLLSSSSL